jgi:hypothetical protein
MKGERDPKMGQTKKGNQWFHRFAEGFAYGMKVHSGVDKDTGLIHSVGTTAANVHDLTPSAELLHGEEEVLYGDAGYQGIGKRPEMAGKSIEFRVAMRPGKRRALPDTPEGRLLDLVAAAKAHIHTKVEHPFRVIKQKWGIPEDGTARHGEKLVQGARAGSTDQSDPGTSSTTGDRLTRELVCPFRQTMPQEQDQTGSKSANLTRYAEI